MIKVLKFEECPTQFQPQVMYKLSQEEFTVRAAEFRKWCEDNKVFYYSRPGRQFFMAEAFQLAAIAKCDRIILENLS